jgi:hypothetical protein
MLYEYPEFPIDVKEAFKALITDFNFSSKEESADYVKLCSDSCCISIYIDEYTVSFSLYNPASNRHYPKIMLDFFFGIKGDDTKHIYEGIEWSKGSGFEFERKEMQLSLKLLFQELMHLYRNILLGDYSWENNYIEWEKWLDSEWKGKNENYDADYTNSDHWVTGGPPSYKEYLSQKG